MKPKAEDDEVDFAQIFKAIEEDNRFHMPGIRRKPTMQEVMENMSHETERLSAISATMNEDHSDETLAEASKRIKRAGRTSKKRDRVPASSDDKNLEDFISKVI